MTTTVLLDNDILLHGKSKNFTKAEVMRIQQEASSAFQRGDMDEYVRISKTLPIDAKVAKAFKQTYGKDFILNSGYDLTEANLEWGEGWLDEPNEE